MTRDEFETFTESLFTSFPGILEWVNAKSPNPAGTLATWYDTLRDVSYDEASSVLNRWKNGTREPPKAYERDYVAIVIRQTVAFDRSQQARFSQARDMEKSKADIAKRRRDYQSPMGDMVEAFEIACVALAQMDAGEITKQEYDRICWEAVK